MTLRALGLSGVEETTYQLLVATGPTDLPHLAALTQRPVGEVSRTLGELRDKGLVTVLEEDPPRVTPAPPDVALAPLLLNEQAALSEASRLVTELSEQHRANERRRDPDQLVQVLTGTEAIRQAIRTMQLSTREELLWFCRAGHVAMPSSDNDEEFAMLARGVRYRVIYEQALLEEPGMLDSLAEGVQAGEEARATARLPIRMAIADRSVALCPLVPARGAQSEPTAAIVRESNLLTALIALFDGAWAAASPLLPTGRGAVPSLSVAGSAAPGPDSPVAPDADPARTPAPGVGAEELELLSLLVAGVTDKAIATRLGVSTRTVQRRISDLMTRTGARSRMQLAWQVAQRGWLERTGAPSEGGP